MKVLVTGAAGFIGGNLMKSLVAREIEVIGVDNFSTYYAPTMKHAHVKTNELSNYIHTVDICDEVTLNELFQDFQPTHVVHLAAQGGVRASKSDPLPYLQTNQNGFLNVLNAAENIGAKKFIFASSSSVYGDGVEAPYKESELLSAPKSLYALSKFSNELIAKYLPRKQTQRIGFRFFTVYGPWGRPDMAIFRLLASSILQEKFKLTANTSVMRDFTYVDDVSTVIANLISLDSNFQESEIFNIAGGSPFTLDQLFQIMNELNIAIDVEEAPMDSLDVKMTHGSVSKLEKNNLPVPSTPLRKGIEKTWDWMNRIDKEELRSWFEYSK